MNQFIEKHRGNVIGVLNGWDRVRFRGTIRMLAVVRGLMGWLWDQQVLLTQFRKFSLDLTAKLQASVEAVAASAGKKVRYVASSTLSKEDLVQELIRREGLTEGIVCVLSCVEPCRSYELRGNRETKHLDLLPALRKCLHWYVYLLDRRLGLCHVRIQSWLPFTVHVCVNGREILCRELAAAGIGFQRRDNCLVDVADVATAQRMLDAQPWWNWKSLLDDLLHRACPDVCRMPIGRGVLSHYWSADETEWATDILFRSSAALSRLYPPLVWHAMTTFSSPQVMRFLGRRQLPAAGGVYARFAGEVVSDLSIRPEGVRVKHQMNGNSVKMYDKQGSVLRVETTINNPRDLTVHRTSETDPEGPKTRRKLRKGVVDLPCRAKLSQAVNQRYLTALTAVDSSLPLGKLADRLQQPVMEKGRRVRGMNLLTGADAQVAQILLRGEFCLTGFRNRDIRGLLFPDNVTQPSRSQSGSVTRVLRLFRAHGLIRKLPRTHRYQLTARGRRELPTFIAARHASTKQLTTVAA